MAESGTTALRRWPIGTRRVARVQLSVVKVAELLGARSAIVLEAHVHHDRGVLELLVHHGSVAPIPEGAVPITVANLRDAFDGGSS